MPLHIIIVGAGIAGLASAIALGREGHRVDIYERSGFANEVGAAYHSGPYAVRIFKRWGLDLAAMRSLVVESWEERDCERPSEMLDCKFVLADKQREYGIEPGLDEIMHHRIDAHRTLRAHALAMANVQLHLSSPTVRVDADAASITLADGSTHAADLVIGADGIHSRAVEAIDPEAAQTSPVGINMYRFMVPSALAKADPDVAPLLAAIDFPRRHIRFVHQPTQRSIVLYSCRDGELINCATFHLARDDLVKLAEGDYTSKGTLDEVLHLMQGWPKAYQALAALAEDIKHWAIINRDVPRAIVKGRLALVGDAAHPTQPTWAAGANMGVEDAAVLGVLFDGTVEAKDVPARLELFQKLRYERVVTVKYYSEMQNMAWADFKAKTEAQIRRRCGGDGAIPEDIWGYLWKFDAMEDAKRAVGKA